MNQLAQVRVEANRLESALRHLNFEAFDYWANALNNEIMKVVAGLNDLPINSFTGFTAQIRHLDIIPKGLEDFSRLVSLGKFDSPGRLWQSASAVIASLETLSIKGAFT